MKKIFAVLGTVFATGALTATMALNVFASHTTEENAKSIALEHAGVKAEDILFIKCESDFEYNRWVYEIEFLTSDFTEYDYEIDKNTGEILSMDYDAEYDFPAQNLPQDNSNRNASKSDTATAAFSLEDAKTTALGYAGLNETDVTWEKVKQDYDDGRMVYEGTFYYGAMEYEFEIDAASGAVIDWEVESIFD